MKKLSFFIMAAMLLAVGCTKIASKQDKSLDLPPLSSNGTLPGDDPIIGYATVGGGTTGGAGGSVDTVTTLLQLTTAAQSVGTKMIYVSGTITSLASPSPIIYVRSNKSIIGLPGSSLVGVCLFMNAENESVSNVIIQNMKMSNTLLRSCISVKDSAHNIWIDHNELWTDRSHGWDYYDGLCDVTGTSKNITISWNKFHDNNIPVLISNGETYHIRDTVIRVTLHHNYFLDCSERMPRVAFARVHFFNNYMNGGTTAAGYSTASTQGATVRTDNNYYENITTPIRTNISPDPVDGFISGASTNYFAPSCGSNSIGTTASTWVPTEYSYSSYLTSAAQAKTDVMAGAGVFAVPAGPTITSQPVGGLFTIGTSVSLSVSATGSGLTYQWKKNGTNVSGATSSTLTSSSVQPADQGSYTVVVTSSSGSATSTAAVVKVNLLLNNGFENDLTSWTKTYGTSPLINTNALHVHSGAKSLISGPAAGEGRGQYINSGFTVGASYTIATWGKVSSTSGGTIEVEIQYFNSGGTRISKVTGANPNSTTFAQSSFSSTIPTGTTSILILVWNNGGKTFYSDDWSYTKD